jgi:predicted nucleotide-binding protein
VPYHVRITSKDPQRRHHDALALDKETDWIEAHIAAPRREGRDIFVDGQVFSWDSIDQILITETGQTSEQLLPEIRARRQGKSGVAWIPDRWFVASDGRNVTEQFITGPPGTGPRADASKVTTFSGNRKAVMVIYGHDKPANDALFDWLRAIGLQPREWSQLIHGSRSASPFIGDVLEKALRDVQAVIAFFTPDEYVTAAAPEDHDAGRHQARPNVLIEAGMALITHPTRTIIAVLGTQELPSDLAGRHYIRISHTAVEPLHDLAARLHDAGCDTDITGNDWLSPTRFPERDTVAPPADLRPATSAEPASELHDTRTKTEASKEAQYVKEDTEARQMVVTIEAQSGPDFTHLITVSTPITYPVKQVEVQIAWQTNGGLGMTSTGFAGDPPSTDDHRRRYRFRASINPQIHNPEPVVRFVDLHSNRYYQYRDHTQRFSSNTDWIKAATVIDLWLRTGPRPD